MVLNNKNFIFLLWLTIFLFFLNKNTNAAAVDSVGMEKVGEKYFVLHKVEKNEDIYQIAKKYGITAKEIIGDNQQLQQQDLKPGMMIRVAYKKHVPVMKAYRIKSGESLLGICKRLGVKIENIHKLNGFYHSKIKAGQQILVGFDIKNPDVFNVPYDLNKQWQLSYHTVQQGETLFRIAKDYKTKTDSIALWNGLENNQIKVGQLILVGRKLAGSKEVTGNTPETAQNEVSEENGVGEVMYLGSPQLYALHNGAAVGSFLIVFNESLNRSVRVKVIGEIPKNDANKKFIIKLSEAACEELGFGNREFFVKIKYRSSQD